MAQPYLTNTQRGRGWKHRQAAARLWREFREGDICRKCGRPMWKWQKLDAGHPPSPLPLHVLVQIGTPPLPDAIEHRACNRAAGQRLGAARRKAARRAHLPQW